MKSVTDIFLLGSIIILLSITAFSTTLLISKYEDLKLTGYAVNEQACTSVQNCPANNLCENQKCRAMTDTEIRAKDKYAKIEAKLKLIEDEIAKLKANHAGTGAAVFSPLSRFSSAQNNIVLAAAPYTLNWYKDNGIKLIDDRIKNIHKELCALAQNRPNMNFGNVTIYNANGQPCQYVHNQQQQQTVNAPVITKTLTGGPLLRI